MSHVGFVTHMLVLCYYRNCAESELLYLPTDADNSFISEYCQLLFYRGSYMSAHVLMNLLNKLRKRDKM